ncbi:MAG: hypothetical protein DSM106950_43310 [Stigonema ocellatum SAG 48.90 = DSM 106950]|nr:hypothetical protein [Stigonema ocellatum SAG 48.90 = DSM 106950]
MHNPCEGVESVAEMIARLVCDYEARQVATKSAALPDTQDESQKRGLTDL